MEHWDKIDGFLVKLEKYKNRKEWIRYFNCIEGIRKSESEIDLDLQSGLINYYIAVLEIDEESYMRLTDKGDTEAYEAVYLIVNVLLYKHKFKKSEPSTEDEDNAIMEKLYEMLRYYKKHKRSEYDSLFE